MIRNLLPIGSVIRLHNSFLNYKILIINRIIQANQNGVNGCFEYAGCKHIVGAIRNEIFYFNNENIAEVYFEGYKDEEEIEFQIQYRSFLELNILKKLTLKD